ncbi:unnamed protein product [Aphanomyces euteiches]|uniref:glucan 1,4-alpha-glucosidase n=1 Tax=Aphanomyces euteiches TaxID=100861 RepID=A0A6G0X0A9_9STRA|nr:hypothetical protein Ae201684_009794 [Aphanomyces euteiches]KAH9095993.1 hypothetical protein Ae201684P_010199 [Aphanomyces euteiches]
MVFAAVKKVFAVLAFIAICHAANEVKVNSYTFDGTKLTGTVTLKNLAYTKTVTVIYANTAQTWGNTCSAGYTSGPDSSNNEIWSFNCPISSAGITQFYVEYNVNGATYYDNNGGYGSNYQVTTPTSAPGTPGFQADITTFLSSGLPSFKTFLLNNISPKNVSGALAGSIIAASPGGANNYVFHWLRDSGLVMDVVNEFYKAGDTALEQTFWDHAAFNKKLQGLTTQTGLGEPKYNVDGTAFNNPWCRPQNDGPAVRASSFIRFSKAYLAKGGLLSKVVDLYNGTATGVIKNDIAYVISKYSDSNGCDLWEEQRGLHFFTVAVQRRAVYEARDFANFLGDAASAATYSAAATNLDAKLATFWNANAQSVQTTINARLLDAAIPLGAIHGNNGDGVFAPEDDRILSSIAQLESGFVSEYTLNQNVKTDASGLPLSLAIGRYYGDTYDGSSNSQGNPWYLCTLSVAESVFRAATAYVKAGSITAKALNQKLFNAGAPVGLGLNVATGTYAKGTTQFTSIIEGLKVYGDKHIRRVKFHGAAGNHFNEQFNRNTGVAQGVNDLTWPYAALISTNNARAELKALSS